MNTAFPLILTFSLREKGQQLYIFGFAKIVRAAGHWQFAKAQETFHHRQYQSFSMYA
jgi:hypothetical protein